MILIGQYDSPFVRRVAIALTLYDLPFEHRPWSSFGDADELRALNPLTRVPTLILDDGDVLVDSHCIIDHLDSLVPAGRAMFPRVEPDRRRALGIAALASGIGDKAVSLFYEQAMHQTPSEPFMARCRMQIAAGLAALESERAARPTDYWFGARIGHADIVVATVLRFIGDVHPALSSAATYPALAAHAHRLEALPVFQAIQQPFIAPT